MNFAKLNHILVPSTKEERDRLYSSRRAIVFRAVMFIYNLFTPEGRVLLLFWLASGVMSINVEITRDYVVWGVMTGLLVASLAFRPFVRLVGGSMEVRGPRRVAVGDEVFFTLEIKNESERHHQAIRIEGPFLPWDGQFLSTPPVIEELEPGQSCQRTVTARFQARGEHHLDSFQARALAPFGLAQGAPISSEGLRFLVVPRLAHVLDVGVKTTQRYQPGGVALASITGESRELKGVRPYRAGDPIRDLHARTWARIGEPVVREYQQEYFTRIGVIIDTDGGKADDPVFESSLSLAAGVVARLSRGEALIDLLVIDDEIHRLTLGRSLGFLDQALDLLACVTPKSGFQLSSLQAQLEQHLRRLSSMVLLSIHWDEQRQHFADWIEGQGVRCCSVCVVGKQSSEWVQRSGVTLVQAADIEQGRELIL